MGTKKKWIRAYVEQLLEKEWKTAHVCMDKDGDFPFRFGTAACWVSVMGTDPIAVRVFAHAAVDVKPTAKLLKELNEIQTGTLSATVLYCNGTVIVSQTLSTHGLNRRSLGQAMLAVAGVADDIGVLAASMHGGSTPFAGVPVDEQAC